MCSKKSARVQVGYVRIRSTWVYQNKKSLHCRVQMSAARFLNCASYIFVGQVSQKLRVCGPKLCTCPEASIAYPNNNFSAAVVAPVVYSLCSALVIRKRGKLPRARFLESGALVALVDTVKMLQTGSSLVVLFLGKQISPSHKALDACQCHLCRFETCGYHC